MFYSYGFPFYRSPFVGSFGFGYPLFGFGGFNSFGGINAVGSAIANQSLINTGTASGINQIASPTVIW